jgi:hypothetical protein
MGEGSVFRKIKMCSVLQDIFDGPQNTKRRTRREGGKKKKKKKKENKQKQKKRNASQGSS